MTTAVAACGRCSGMREAALKAAKYCVCVRDFVLVWMEEGGWKGAVRKKWTYASLE